MSHETHHGEASEQTEHESILMPAPTFWPIVFAFGLTLLGAGLVTHWVVSLVGGIIATRGVFGWWRDVIPHEEHEEVPINKALRPAPIMIEARSVVRFEAGEEGHRIRIPERVHPYSAGLWGGLAGGVAMAARLFVSSWAREVIAPVFPKPCIRIRPASGAASPAALPWRLLPCSTA